MISCLPRPAGCRRWLDLEARATRDVRAVCLTGLKGVEVAPASTHKIKHYGECWQTDSRFPLPIFRLRSLKAHLMWVPLFTSSLPRRIGHRPKSGVLPQPNSHANAREAGGSG